MTEGQPAWAAFFIEWMHPASLLMAAALPCLRAFMRGLRGRRRRFVREYIVHDAAAGLLVPSFLALCLTAIKPDILQHVVGHPLQLAGLLGLVYTFSEILGKGPDGKDDDTVF